MPDAPLPPAGHPTDRLIGTAPAIAALRVQIRHLASFDTVGSPAVPTVLLQGETGTGKGLVARIIHDSGPRAAGPFIEVNCAAIPETMLEAELFGFEAGAFTDAKRAKPGLFEAASGGTLFLDEIDALPLALQGKLLTAIESKRVRRLGAVTERAVDVKLIAATNAVLPEVGGGGAVPGRSVSPAGGGGAGAAAVARAGRGYPRPGRGVFAALYRRAWGAAQTPERRGRSLVAGLCLAGECARAEPCDGARDAAAHGGGGRRRDPDATLSAPDGASVGAKTAPAPHEAGSRRALPAEAEQIRQALVQTGGNVVRAARLLGVSRDTVRYRMQRYGIARPRLGAPSPAASPLPAWCGRPRILPSGRGASSRAAGSLDPPLVGGGRKPRDRPRGQMPGTRRRSSATSPTPEPAWEQKPVAVLALELTWPGRLRYRVSPLRPLD